MAERLLAALEAGDASMLRECCAADAVFWNNLDVERSVDEVVTVHAAERRLVPDLRFEDVRLRAAEGGYVQQCTIRGTTVHGVPVAIPVCAVVTVVDGLVTRLEEYVSSSHARPILEGLRGG